MAAAVQVGAVMGGRGFLKPKQDGTGSLASLRRFNDSLCIIVVAACDHDER